MQSIKELIDARNKAWHDAKAILDGAKGGKLTAEAQQHYDRLEAQIDANQAKIDERRKAGAAGRQVPPTRPILNREEQAEKIKMYLGKRRPEEVLKPGSSLHLRAQQRYQDGFNAYLRGDGSPEKLGLKVSADNKGGYLTSTQFASQLIKFLDNTVFMRGLATVMSIGSSVSLGAASWDTDPGDATWGAEVPASDLSEDDTATVGKRELTPHHMTLVLKMSKKFMRSSVINPDTLLAERAAYKFGVTEESAYLEGDSAQQPLGVFVASDNGIASGRDTTASSTTAFTADDMMDTLYSLKEGYQKKATWLLSREFVKRARKLKDGNSQYLWSPGLSGQPGTILDRPYVMSEYVPDTYTTGLYVAAVGDFSYYWIVDSLDMEIQRLDELFALKNQVGMVVRKETDGMPVLSEAFARLKLA
jgi:HK97 family phage major capsid protein